MNQQLTTVDIGKDFTRFPAGRTLSDGPYSGEAFREKFLVPAIRGQRQIRVKLDTALGYGSSFLEEAFGGLVRLGFSAEDIANYVLLETDDGLLKDEIDDYIHKAIKH